MELTLNLYKLKKYMHRPPLVPRGHELILSPCEHWLIEIPAALSSFTAPPQARVQSRFDEEWQGA